ncbi:MAG TPA: hypothetical protein VM432_00690 [Bdellovibrionales bacterium]|nr:hypothetical protein [Bdellovibrionales bacterium]
MKWLSLISLVLAFSVTAAAAKEFPVQARLFAGSASIDPSDLNTEMKAQDLKTFDTLFKLGVEITYPVWKFTDVGIRYSHNNAEKEDSDKATDYKASISQETVVLLARFPIVKLSWFRFDVFGAAGGSNTTFTIKTASQNGELTKRESNDWWLSPVFAYGGSVAFGYKWIFLAIESGFESNKVDGFKRVGTINDNVQAIDLSGQYFLVSLMFDGIPGQRK